MQHIRHTRQALSRLFSPERSRLSIAPARDGERCVPAKRQHLGKGLLAAPPAPRRVWTDEFWPTAPPTEPLPTPGAPGTAGSGRSSSAASPPTSHRHARPRLLRLLPWLCKTLTGPCGRQSSLESSQQRRAEPLLPPACGEEAMPSAVRLPQPQSPARSACGHRLVPQSRALPAGRLLACFSSPCFPVNCTRGGRDNAGLFSALPPVISAQIMSRVRSAGAGTRPRLARGEITGPALSPPLFLFF